MPWIRHVLEHVDNEHHVERFVGERQVAVHSTERVDVGRLRRFPNIAAIQLEPGLVASQCAKDLSPARSDVEHATRGWHAIDEEACLQCGEATCIRVDCFSAPMGRRIRGHGAGGSLFDSDASVQWGNEPCGRKKAIAKDPGPMVAADEAMRWKRWKPAICAVRIASKRTRRSAVRGQGRTFLSCDVESAA